MHADIVVTLAHILLFMFNFNNLIAKFEVVKLEREAEVCNFRCDYQ